MHKLSVYVETSVWSQALAEDAPDMRAATELFLAAAKAAESNIFISVVVLREISRASNELAKKLRSLINEIAPVVLPFDDEMDQLAQAFLEHGVVPPSKVEDAQHVAVAVANELDVLVSWNYRHLVNVRRREEFHQVSVMKGFYKPLQIVTPPEVNDES
jgi:predicted nucleic acid-binding protein